MYYFVRFNYFAKLIIKKGLSVRQTERLVGEEGGRNETRLKETPKDVDTLILEDELSTSLGLQVKIKFLNHGGSIILKYRDVDQLDYIIKLLKNS